MERNKLKLKLVGIDGNAFSIMGAFSKQAKREGWTKQEIDDVLKVAMSGDYDKLLRTIAELCENNGAGSDEDLDEEFDCDDDEHCFYCGELFDDCDC